MNKFTTLLASALLLFSTGLVTAAPTVDINAASAEVLAERLSGVGFVKARAIVAYRKANGPFGTAEQLQNVVGIGPKIVEMNEGRILIRLPDQKALERATAAR